MEDEIIRFIESFGDSLVKADWLVDQIRKTILSPSIPKSNDSMVNRPTRVRKDNPSKSVAA